MKFEEQTLDYILPSEKIASFPLPVRHESKLLVYKNKQIIHEQFYRIADHIEAGSMLVFNNTKVFHARMHFITEHGKNIEVFCLEPANGADPGIALSATRYSEWICLIGGAKKWKSGPIKCVFNYENDTLTLEANLISRKDELFHIAFNWDNAAIMFSEIVALAGELPLPPYMNRKANAEDELRYQTVYAKENGSVAAPTAGLHFTEEVMQLLERKNIELSYITLHVGAGTFKPMKSDNFKEHIMHEELIDISISALEHIKLKPGKIIAVGTTSLRTIESLYWMGVKVCLNNSILLHELNITQWEAYELNQHIAAENAFEALIQWMKQNKLTRLICKTQIMITPAYTLKVAEGLITNFHQPKSTLLLIIAAVTGKDWENIYTEALRNEYRFLSYGDSSLLMKSKQQQ